MPPGDPPLPPPDPHTGTLLIRALTDSIHNQQTTPMDVNMEATTETAPVTGTSRQSHAAPSLEEFPLLNFFKAIRADPTRRNESGTLNLDATTEALLLQLIKGEARRSHYLNRVTETLQDVVSRVTTIEAGQLLRKPPAPGKSYASTATKPKAPPQPPTKLEMVAARPGLTIIHSRTGTAPLKEVNTEIVVQKTNKVLEKMNTTVQGDT
ncbi:hypothetical protein PGT21_003831 [Puccinia graminis f. sp. tritici]|uniref:Uncharacterized protein n=1 Tax=Puccinia graminis f. sp. tritici TaxID=56615 RepID=A0A5B0LYR4_PUCGR|nr:hypothetical protein PGT21_003831 [Puccinia graminis f. sp. tritici]